MVFEWQRVKLGDICNKIGSGATPKGGKDTYCTEGISLIRSQNVLDFAFSDDGLAHINDEQARKLNNVEVKLGDVLLNITGDSVARVCIAEDDYLPARVNQHVAIIRGNTEKVISSYLLYFLQMEKPHLLQLASAGATRNALTKGMIEQMELALPPLDEQRRIVGLLDALQKKIHTNNKINDNLQQQLEALYRGTIKSSTSECHSVTLDEWCHIFTGKKNANQFDENGQYVFFTCGEKPLRINSYVYDGPAIIISGNGSYTGRTLFYNGKFDLYQRTYACTLKEAMPADFIFGLFAILKIELHTKIAGGTHGSSIPYIVMNDLAKFEFPFNRAEFADFSEKAKTLLTTIQHNQQQNEALAQVRDALLPKLMSGEIDVSNINF